jgi:23S rRNA (cytidine1920-2'-O)/16S rRNA (cytidine1409-2'-O)-methyltransferase
VPTSRRRRFVALVELLAQRRPDVGATAIEEARVIVDGRFVTNPRAQVPADASVRVLGARRLRGDIKLSFALDTLSVPVDGRVAVDVGANAGGFTTALLDRGARRVYAVEAGFGQLLGRLRTDPRVVNLEGHNLAVVDRSAIPDVVGLITMDLSYLAISDALPQLGGLELPPSADLVVLVKPTFELRAASLATEDEDVQRAVERVEHAMTRLGWDARGRCDAPTTGRRGAREVFLHGRRERPSSPHRPRNQCTSLSLTCALSRPP